MSAKRPDLDRDHAIELYLSGEGAPDIARLLGCSSGAISRIVQKAGVARTASEARRAFMDRGGSHPRYRADIPADGVAERYAAGESMKRIAADLGVAPTLIQKRLADAGVARRNPAAARLLIDRQKATALGAERRSKPVGFGEDQLAQWLEQRGERPDRQRPAGTKNIDVAIGSIAVEVWLSSSSPLADSYCRDRLEYLIDRQWTVIYVLVARRTRVLLPQAADQIVSLAKIARADPSAPRQHWVIRGCGEIAATFGDDLRHGPLMPPSVDCRYHRGVNKR